MTRKENFLAALRGEKPEWIPNYTLDCQTFNPSALGDVYGELYGQYFDLLEKGEDFSSVKAVDAFGVTWVLDEYGPITEPGNILLEDISEWREKFTIPDLTGYDWDRIIREEYEAVDPEKAVETIVTGPFMTLVNAMGFEGALMALAMAEDDLTDFLDAVIGFQSEVLYQTFSRVHVDALNLFDDFANATTTFMSPDTFRELLLPYEKRLIDAARKADPDILVDMHVCGKCDAVIPDLMDAGINAWQPAQPLNDLMGLKERYGNKLVLIGAWDNVKICSAVEKTEEEVRQSVRECLDQYGKDGGFIFWEGGAVGTDPKTKDRLEWAIDEVEKYGHEMFVK